MGKSTENTIGKNLVILRKRKGYTQADLASKTGLGVRTIQSIEKGERKPRPNTINTLEMILEVPLGTLSSNSIREADIYWGEAKDNAKEEAIDWFIKNMDTDSPNTRALSLCISDHIDKNHSFVRYILEKFGYTTTYIPTFQYSASEYRKCVDVMLEYDEKAIFPSFFKNWDIFLMENDDNFEEVLKNSEETYLNENLNYPLLIHRIEEQGDTLLANPPLTRRIPLSIRITQNGKFISQVTLHKFLVLTNRILTSIDNAILSSTDLQEEVKDTGTIIPNLPEDLRRNQQMNRRKHKLNPFED